MNQSILIRCVAAALVAAIALPAQSAPVSPPKAVHAEQQGPEKASVQARLSEVIELLAKDDLSPEQRADAKKALEEIAAHLRHTPAAGPRPPKPPKAPKPAKTPRAVEVAPEPMEPLAPGQARRPRVFRSVETPGEPVEIVEVTPEGERPADITVVRRHAEASRKAAEEARTRAKVAEVHAEAEKSARAGRVWAARAPADHARKAEVEAREHAEHAKTMHGRADAEAKGPDTVTTLRPTRRKVELDEGEGDDAEIRAVIEEMRREMREIRELMQQLREKAQGRATGQGGGASSGRFSQMGGDVRAGYGK